eukprot:PhF_6_TR43328/c0_g1_i4/m.66236
MFFTPFHLKAERDIKTALSQENTLPRADVMMSNTITKSNSDEDVDHDPLLKKLYIPAEVVAKYTTTVPSTPLQQPTTATPTPTVFKSKVKNTKYSYEVMIPPSSSNSWQTAIITTPIP